MSCIISGPTKDEESITPSVTPELARTPFNPSFSSSHLLFHLARCVGKCVVLPSASLTSVFYQSRLHNELPGSSQVANTCTSTRPTYSITL